MPVKHKVLQDFQFLQADKKIIILKAKTLLLDFTYQSKTDSVVIPEDIINSNPEYFQHIDWRMDFLSELKSLKVPQPTIVSKKLIPFVENLLIESNNQIPVSDNRDFVKELKEKDSLINQKNTLIEELQSTIQHLTSELEIEKNKEISSDYVSKAQLRGITEGLKQQGWGTDLIESVFRNL